MKVVNIALVIPQYLLKQRSSKIVLSEIRLLFLKFISLQRSRGSSKVLSFRRIVLPLSQIVINPHISLHFVATLRILWWFPQSLKKVSDALGKNCIYWIVWMELFKVKMPCTVRLVFAIGLVRPLSSNYIP